MRQESGPPTVLQVACIYRIVHNLQAMHARKAPERLEEGLAHYSTSDHHGMMRQCIPLSPPALPGIDQARSPAQPCAP